MTKTIDLGFDGYWVEANLDYIPDESGIYLVYCCRKTESGVLIRRLIYIGESEGVQGRIDGHEKKTNCWNKQLQKGEVLCYSFAPASNPDRERAEAALIFRHKPVCNDEFVDSFPFEQTTVSSSGRNKFIIQSFTVHKTR